MVNHPGGNKQVAGLVIAAATGTNQVEAALLSDDASRFGRSVNPMLEQLFSAWHPGGEAATSESSSGRRSAPPAVLHQVTLPDNSASVGVPNGWRVDPTSAYGTMVVKGPHGELVGLNLARNALDPTDPVVRQLRQGGILTNAGDRIVCPYNVDLLRAFPEIMLQWRRLNGMGAPDLEHVQAERVSGPGQRCIHAAGNVDGDGKGEQEMNMVMCTTPPTQGNYMVLIFQSLLPVAVADEERANAAAIFASFQVNHAVVAQQANAIAAPAIAAIQQIGRDATAQYNARQAANDAQHAGYWEQQDSNTRSAQSFSHYQLDMTVIQDNNMYGNGTVGHGTAWTSAAESLVKADPDRFQYVESPNYIRGTDF